jgi:hypothetical protein
MRALLVVGLLLAASCRGGDNGGPDETPEGSDPTPARTVKPGQHGPIAEGDFVFEGAVELSGDYSVLYPFSDKDADTCSELAGAKAGRYVVPLPSFKEARRFVWTAGLREYQGPGEYDLTDLERLVVEIRANEDAEPEEFASAKGSTATLKVDEDNGGSLIFKKLQGGGGDELSGEARWTCSE